ncbi:MAG TPA: response regulator transcription factor [Candidatus Saccharimonadales bacterium]|nr:response regulator transcription factor [Candidatus Saccharimonadales bacterium]
MANSKNRILLIDDDEQLVALLAMKLTQAGNEVDGVTSPDEGYNLALTSNYDLIVLDLVMPKRGGLEICADLRSQGVLVPILILSGKTDKEIVVRGLGVGADDYLTKPFSSSELIARIDALLRRNKKLFKVELLQREEVELDLPSNIVRYGKLSIRLTQKETLLLRRLMAEAPKVVSRSTLLQDVWGINSDYASNRLDVYIRRVRTKLRQLCGSDCIHTVRGRGYHFKRV